MNLSLEKLRENPKAVEKYKDRDVKIYHGVFNLWFYLTLPVTNREKAEIYVLSHAMELCKYYHNSSKIEFYFVDIIGENTPKITDFDPEDVYNCPTVTFESYRSNNKL